MCQVYRLNCLVTKRRQSFHLLSSFTFSCFLLVFISLLLVGVGVQADSDIMMEFSDVQNSVWQGAVEGWEEINFETKIEPTT